MHEKYITSRAFGCDWFECCFNRLFINYSLSSRLLWYQLLRCLFYILLRYWLYYKMRMFSMSSHLWLLVDHKSSTNSTEDKYHENGTNEYVKLLMKFSYIVKHWSATVDKNILYYIIFQISVKSFKLKKNESERDLKEIERKPKQYWF